MILFVLFIYVDIAQRNI